MSNNGKRAEGAAEELGGKIKGSVGKLIGNDRMQAALVDVRQSLLHCPHCMPDGPRVPPSAAQLLLYA